MKIFFDTGAFIALFVSTDKYHQLIARKYQEYRRQRVLFFTSDYVLDELFTRLMYDFGKSITQKTLSLLEKSIAAEELSVLNIDATTFKKAKEAFLKFAEHRISFTDATTYVLYKNLALDEVCTLDGDFRKIYANTSFGDL